MNSIGWIIVLALLVICAVFLPRFVMREKYGPPIGAARAIKADELGDRGWATACQDFHANSASSISQFVERSA
jgi:hypothetical protein